MPTDSYYHWLSMAYASTVVGHPSVTLPLGRDRAGMPFGLQIIGRKGDDLGTLAVAAEIESLCAGDDLLRPVWPDMATLAAATPLNQAEGFLGFA